MTHALSPIDRLLQVMARLRDPASGCPWDVEQSFATIAPYTIEEAYEVADAIERKDLGALQEELGDLLFQVVFHARMAEEEGAFDFDAVAGGMAEKMIRRHPHVFADAQVATARAQSVAWETHKAAEREAKAASDSSTLADLPLALPALMRAQKLQKRAARVGFDWPTLGPVIDKIEEELDEVRAELDTKAPHDRLEDEIGDLLFAVVNLARFAHVDAETALRRANAKFERRFRRIETLLAERGKRPEDSDLAEMDTLWNQAKAEERGG